MLEACCRKRINAELQEAIAERQIECYLTMLLRLRQASTHPFLLEGMMAEYFTIHDLKIVKKRLAMLSGRETIYEQLESWTKRHGTPNERVVEVMASAEQEFLEEGNRFQESRQNTPEEHIAQTSKAGREYMDVQPGGTQSPAPNNTFLVDGDPDEVDSEDEVEEDADGMIPDEYLSGANADTDCAAESTSYPHDEPEIARLNPFGQSNFGLHFEMTKHLEYLERHELLEIAKCGICNRKPNSPFKGNVSQRCSLARHRIA